MNSQKELKIASYVSAVLSIIIMLLKFWAYYLTHSQAIFSDAVESIVNVVTSVFAIVVVHISNKPADRDHPYGHGKVEYFSAAFEGGMISLAAIVIAVESIHVLFDQSPIKQMDQGFWYMSLAAIANLALGLYLLKVGKKNKSPSIVASGHHVLSDFWTTFGVSIGVGLVLLLKQTWIDPVCALIVSFFLAKTGFELVKESIGGLLDAEDKKILESLRDIIAKDQHPGIIQVHHCRIMRSGKYHHIDAHAVVPEFWDISEAHRHTQAFETRMIEKYPYDGELHLHMDPCRRAYCKVCDLEKCHLRAAKFEKALEPSLEDLVNPEEPESFKLAGDHPAE